MKKTTTVLAVAATVAGVLFFSGCGKPQQAAPGAPPPQAINAQDFRPAFASATPEIKSQVDQVMMDIQSSMFPNALNDLAKLAANPALTDAQKKAVNSLSDQVKNKIAALAVPPH